MSRRYHMRGCKVFTLLFVYIQNELAMTPFEPIWIWMIQESHWKMFVVYFVQNMPSYRKKLGDALINNWVINVSCQRCANQVRTLYIGLWHRTAASCGFQIQAMSQLSCESSALLYTLVKGCVGIQMVFLCGVLSSVVSGSLWNVLCLFGYWKAHYVVSHDMSVE